MPINHVFKFADLTSYQSSLIGKFLLEFSNLEFSFGLLFSKLLMATDLLAMSLLERMTIQSVVTSIKSMLDIHCNSYQYAIITKEQQHSIEEVLQKAEELRKTRNAFAHNIFFKQDEETIVGIDIPKLSVHIMKYFFKDEGGGIIIKNTELENKIKDCYQLVDELSELLTEMSDNYNEKVKKKIETK